MAKYMVDCVREYILTCPFLDKLANLGVNFLDSDSSSYSIEEVPSKTIIEGPYVDGSSKRQFVFVFASNFNYSEELEQQLKNSGFYEDFSDWIEENNERGVFPSLKEGLTPESIEVGSSGYLYGIVNGMKKARYQIQLKLIYEKKGRW